MQQQEYRLGITGLGQALHSHICLFSCKTEIILQYLLFAEQACRWECGFQSINPVEMQITLVRPIYNSRSWFFHSVLAIKVMRLSQAKAEFNVTHLPKTICIGNIVYALTQRSEPGAHSLWEDVWIHFKWVSVFPQVLSYMCAYLYVYIVNVFVHVRKEGIYFIKLPEGFMS